MVAGAGRWHSQKLMSVIARGAAPAWSRTVAGAGFETDEAVGSAIDVAGDGRRAVAGVCREAMAVLTSAAVHLWVRGQTKTAYVRILYRFYCMSHTDIFSQVIAHARLALCRNGRTKIFDDYHRRRVQ